MYYRTLQKEELDSVMHLYADYGKEDFYYKALFKGQNVAKCIIKSFSLPISVCIELGLCIGKFEDNVLLSYVILFNADAMKSFHPDIYDMIFDKASKLRNKVDTLSANTNFIITLYAHDDSYTELLECMLQEIGHDKTYITDVIPTEPLLASMQELGFVRSGKLLVLDYGKVW